MHGSLLGHSQLERAQSGAGTLLVLGAKEFLFERWVGWSNLALFASPLVHGGVAGPLRGRVSDGTVVNAGLVGPAVLAHPLRHVVGFVGFHVYRKYGMRISNSLHSSWMSWYTNKDVSCLLLMVGL